MGPWMDVGDRKSAIARILQLLGVVTQYGPGRVDGATAGDCNIQPPGVNPSVIGLAPTSWTGR